MMGFVFVPLHSLLLFMKACLNFTVDVFESKLQSPCHLSGIPYSLAPTHVCVCVCVCVCVLMTILYRHALNSIVTDVCFLK